MVELTAPNSPPATETPPPFAAALRDTVVSCQEFAAGDMEAAARAAGPVTVDLGTGDVRIALIGGIDAAAVGSGDIVVDEGIFRREPAGTPDIDAGRRWRPDSG